MDEPSPSEESGEPIIDPEPLESQSTVVLVERIEELGEQGADDVKDDGQKEETHYQFSEIETIDASVSEKEVGQRSTEEFGEQGADDVSDDEPNEEIQDQFSETETADTTITTVPEKEAGLRSADVTDITEDNTVTGHHEPESISMAQDVDASEAPSAINIITDTQRGKGKWFNLVRKHVLNLGPEEPEEGDEESTHDNKRKRIRDSNAGVVLKRRYMTKKGLDSSFKKDKDKKLIEKKRRDDEESRKKAAKAKTAAAVWTEPNYNTDDMVAKAILSPNCSINENILQFYHSYGYDCSRRHNLHMLDETTLVYVSGNYLHFYNIETRTVSLRRATEGSGLGHIAVHPERTFFAVGEKGVNPNIVVYKWPQLTVHRILRKGTIRGYAYLDFNDTGELLCSQGMDPDYLLTIWSWEYEQIVLRYKAYSQDVFQATFSENVGILTSCGMGHIRFWKMAETFTGLKLQGELGRFGKTEISDVQGYVTLVDGKTVTGCEWGNMLIWDGGLILVEIVQPTGKPCHTGEITGLYVLATPEILTIGLDGYMKLWETETLEVADTAVDDSGMYEVEPLHELKLSGTSKPVCAIQSIEKDAAEVWLVQDSTGKVWKADFGKSMKDSEYKAQPIFRTPGGSITGIATSPLHSVMAVASSSGQVWLMEYIGKEPIARRSFGIPATQVMWIPIKQDPRGVSLLVGFGDGTLRLLSYQPKTGLYPMDDGEEELPYELCLQQALKVHRGAVLVLKFDELNNTLYCCGEDRVIFGFYLYWDEESSCTVIYPMSFVTAPFPVACLDLHPFKGYRMLIASKAGRVAECRRPIWGDVNADLSYNQGKMHGRRWWYTSVKSQRKKEERRVTRRQEKEKKMAELLANIKQRKASNVFVDQDLEVSRLNEYYRRLQAADDEEPLHIPEKPCPILGIYYYVNPYTTEGQTGKSFFIHVGGYDSGYIYEAKATRPTPGGFHRIPPARKELDDVGITAYIIAPDHQYLIFGMEDGSIRVMPKKVPKGIFGDKEKEQVILETADDEDRDEEKDDDNDDDDDKKQPSDSAIGDTKESKAVSARGDTVSNRKGKKDTKAPPPFPVSEYPYDLENYLVLPMHDPDRGAVNQLAWSHDYQFLFSVGSDGSIFGYRWDPENLLSVVDHFLPDISLPEEPLNTDPVWDVEESALTLEDQKSKDEDDRVFEETEAEKNIVRRELRKLKIMFHGLKVRNNELPEDVRLSPDKFLLDARIYEPYREEMLRAVEHVYRRAEWESLKNIVLMKKLHDRFYEEIETPLIIVKDIEHTTQVESFRQRVLTDDFFAWKEKNEAVLREEASILKEDSGDVPPETAVELEGPKRILASDLIGEYEGKNYDTGTKQAIRRLEKRLDKRYQRELRWQQLNSEKIPSNYIAPEDAEAKRVAMEGRGNFRLKIHPDYVGEHISVANRRQKIIDLKIKMHAMIRNFNSVILDLREEKYEVVNKCKDLVNQLKGIRKCIPKVYWRRLPAIYEVEMCEEPEKEHQIESDQVYAHISREFEKLGLSTDKITDTENIINGITSVPRSKIDMLRDQAYEPVRNVDEDSKVLGRIKNPDGLDDEMVSTGAHRNIMFKPDTEIGQKRYLLYVRRNNAIQERLWTKLNKILMYFNERVRSLRVYRINMLLDLKLLSLRYMNLCLELMIAKEYDTMEKNILERLRVQKLEWTAAKQKQEKVSRRLQFVKQSVEELTTELAICDKEVASLIGEKHRFVDFLWRLYRKKPSSAKSGESTDHEEEDEEEEGTIRSASSKSSHVSGSVTTLTAMDSKRPRMNLDICPEQLDRLLYDKICMIRDRKNSLEESFEIQNKEFQRLTKMMAEVGELVQRYEGRIADIGDEIKKMRRERQARINELQVLAIVRADQIQCFEDGELDVTPGDYLDKIRLNFPVQEEMVLFPRDGVQQLEDKSKVLRAELNDEVMKYRKMRFLVNTLEDRIKKEEKKMNEISEKIQEAMKLKLGCAVDLDDLYVSTINLELKNLEMQLVKERNLQYQKRAHLNRQLEADKDQYTNIMKQNTKCNNELAGTLERQRELNAYMMKQKRNSYVDPEFDQAQGERLKQKGKDIQLEISKVEEMLSFQENRICMLRQTIDACKRKNGLPPILSFSCQPGTRNQEETCHLDNNTPLQPQQFQNKLSPRNESASSLKTQFKATLSADGPKSSKSTISLSSLALIDEDDFLHLQPDTFDNDFNPEMLRQSEFETLQDEDGDAENRNDSLMSQHQDFGEEENEENEPENEKMNGEDAENATEESESEYEYQE